MDDDEKIEQEVPATSPEAAPVSGPCCPWCSAPYPAEAKHCPSCGAKLIADDDALEHEIVGLTTVDPGLVEHDLWLRSRGQKKRRSILGTLLGRDEEDARPATGAAATSAAPAEGSAILPPSDDVKREMARLEAEAAYARAVAEAEARAIEQKIDEIDAAAAAAAAQATDEMPAPEADPATDPPAADPPAADPPANATAPAPAERPDAAE